MAILFIFANEIVVQKIMEHILLSWYDLLIILVYLLGLIVIGLLLKKRASQNIDSYLLGGNNMPWYMLGLSNASGMFDISGTTWLVTILFVYGMKSLWLPWLWPVFNQVFLMVYLSAWLRRSGVRTGAEWITFRFGTGKDAQFSHWIIVVFALITCLAYLAYGFIGLGKFVEIFIPWEVISPYIPINVSPEFVPHIYGIVFTLFAVFYSVLGGMLSVVWADVMQYVIMSVSSIVIAIIAMVTLADANLIVPDGWYSPFFGWTLDIDWSGIYAEVNEKIASDGYSLFSLFFGLMLFKGILVSLAGPAPTYDMQKILSTKSPKDAAKMSGFVSVALFPIRFLMIAGITVLGILLYPEVKSSMMIGDRIDFEQILPVIIKHPVIPLGVTGIILAGLLAAFMSTFAGTLNAAQAYIVNDVYCRYIRPNASSKQVTRANYLSGIILVIVSIGFGVFALDVNSVMQWIVSGIYGSYVAANVLKWHWWRFNGSGFAWGMVAGLVPALLFPLIFDVLPLYYFPLILIISIIGCIIGTYARPATDREVLKDFYVRTRPWGVWTPILQEVKRENPEFQENKNFKRDMFNVSVGIIWQLMLAAIPIYFVLMDKVSFIVAALILVVTTFTLKKTWYDKLED